MVCVVRVVCVAHEGMDYWFLQIHMSGVHGACGACGVRGACGACVLDTGAWGMCLHDQLLVFVQCVHLIDLTWPHL